MSEAKGGFLVFVPSISHGSIQQERSLPQFSLAIIKNPLWPPALNEPTDPPSHRSRPILAATAVQSTSGVRWHQLRRTASLASSSLRPMASSTWLGV